MLSTEARRWRRRYGASGLLFIVGVSAAVVVLMIQFGARPPGHAPRADALADMLLKNTLARGAAEARGDDAAASTAPWPAHGSTTAAADAASVSNPWLTAQTCYELGDGISEICSYEGPVCWDTVNWEYYVAVPTGMQYGAGLRWGAYDPRYITPRMHRLMGAKTFSLPNLPPAAYADPVAWAHSARVSTINPMREGRLWGPENGIQMMETSWEALVAASSPEDIARLGPHWAAAAMTARDTDTLAAFHKHATLTHFDTGPVRVNSEAVKVPRRVSWILPPVNGRPAEPGKHGTAWVLPMGQDWLSHIFHFSTSAFAMFAAKCANATELLFPFSERYLPGRTFRYRFGGSAAWPSIDAAVFTGSYGHDGRDIKDASHLVPWVRATLPILTHAHTQLVFNSHFRGAPHPSGLSVAVEHKDRDHWVCVPRAGAGSIVNSVFTSTADAAAFRLLAYALANVTVPAVPEHPPRRISIIHRPGRGIFNRSELERTVAATGLPWGNIKLVDGPTWATQVEMFANTGILISPHGAALTNLAFMPARSVVIEVFPAYYRPTMYGALAEKLGLRYYPIVTRFPRWKEGEVADKAEGRRTAWNMFEGPDFAARCESDKSHPSHMDAAWIDGISCGVGKNAGADMDYAFFGYLLEQALDDIGCRDGYCAEAFGGPYRNYKAGGRVGVRTDWGKGPF